MWPPAVVRRAISDAVPLVGTLDVDRLTLGDVVKAAMTAGAEVHLELIERPKEEPFMPTKAKRKPPKRAKKPPKARKGKSRSAVSGKYVSAATARKRPRTTVTERE